MDAIDNKILKTPFSDRDAWKLIFQKAPEKIMVLSMIWWNEVSMWGMGDGILSHSWLNYDFELDTLEDICRSHSDWCRGRGMDPSPIFAATSFVVRVTKKAEVTEVERYHWPLLADNVLGMFVQMESLFPDGSQDSKKPVRDKDRSRGEQKELREAMAIGFLILSDGQDSKSEIAEKVGYADASGLRNATKFNRWFRNRKLVEFFDRGMDQISNQRSIVDGSGQGLNDPDEFDSDSLD